MSGRKFREGSIMRPAALRAPISPIILALRKSGPTEIAERPGRPASDPYFCCSAFTSAAVNGWPPIAHSPLATSRTRTQVTPDHVRQGGGKTD
jgi:hypothetical protein